MSHPNLLMRFSTLATNRDTLRHSAFTSTYSNFFLAFNRPSIKIIVNDLIPFRLSVWSTHGIVFINRKHGSSRTSPCAISRLSLMIVASRCIACRRFSRLVSILPLLSRLRIISSVKSNCENSRVSPGSWGRKCIDVALLVDTSRGTSTSKSWHAVILESPSISSRALPKTESSSATSDFILSTCSGSPSPCGNTSTWDRPVNARDIRRLVSIAVTIMGYIWHNLSFFGHIWMVFFIITLNMCYSNTIKLFITEQCCLQHFLFVTLTICVDSWHLRNILCHISTWLVHSQPCTAR